MKILSLLEKWTALFSCTVMTSWPAFNRLILILIIFKSCHYLGVTLSKTVIFSLFKTKFLTRPPGKTMWHIHLRSFWEFLNKDARQFCVSDPRVCWAKDSTQHVQERPGIILSPWRRREPTMHRLVPATRHMAEPSLRNTPAKCLRTQFHSSVCCCLCGEVEKEFPDCVFISTTVLFLRD